MYICVCVCVCVKTTIYAVYLCTQVCQAMFITTIFKISLSANVEKNNATNIKLIQKFVTARMTSFTSNRGCQGWGGPLL